MQTYISILRGINVSGYKMIKMDALRQAYVDSGFKNVQTYIQSGNVIFQEHKTNTRDLEKRIAKIILDKFSFEVPVIALEFEEIRTIVGNNPFLKDNSKDISYLHVTFLSEVPKFENIDKLIKGQFHQDEFALVGKTIYLFCPNGYGKTKLTNTFFESKLKVDATTRNWKTSNELLVIAEKMRTA